MDGYFDYKRPVRTRDGLRAKIVYVGTNGRYPIAAVHYKPDGTESEPISYTKGGRIDPSRTSALDLENETAERRGWINIHSSSGETFASPEIFTCYSAASRVQEVDPSYRATVEIVWREKL